MNDKNDNKQILLNQTHFSKIEDFDCLECDEPAYFVLQDKYHSFSLSLSTLLNCLKFAENEGVIPAIGEEWWLKVSNMNK
ncbi:hypothetical protein [Gallibacterium anatis]|uniref:Uncharacterized protein n=1 Tax=Gallibacterium anatis TaxID=750 RepID=A0A1A7NYF2_9PAST|nr:hypothetical protein [Gallibacterium anatis]KGQ52481.1 hypothetical protein IE01_11795 [Gallibacterium anatis DSM 16844 = F 149]KGQ61170.1 hypothetical protein IO43_11325 [Gallibacterium anatis 7990]OBW94521.1 hypothetical protein QV02_06990 [Gallibacterium anatis]OBW96258.1 hypothetical protein QV03_11090 [Gallibacterium anatis]STO37391.1 Uncharacterised protein [Gallibacterium anatis]